MANGSPLPSYYEYDAASGLVRYGVNGVVNGVNGWLRIHVTRASSRVVQRRVPSMRQLVVD